MSDGVRVALFFAALFSASAINTAFLPLWFADRGLSATAIGQILGLASLLRVVAGPSWGSLADRIGQRRPVMLTARHHRLRGGVAICPAARVHAVAAGGGRAGNRGIGAQSAINSLALALARDAAHGIRAGALVRLDRLYGGERRCGLAADRHRDVSGAVAAGDELWGGLCGDAVPARGSGPSCVARLHRPAPSRQPSVPPDSDGQRTHPRRTRGVLWLRAAVLALAGHVRCGDRPADGGSHRRRGRAVRVGPWPDRAARVRRD